MHDKIAHTAEHAFIGSLQRILGHTLKVRKVEHKGSGNTAFIVLPELDLKVVLDAQADVNDLIAQGRKVTERIFGSLEEAKSAVPGLRANEERISGQVRVVEIENHDAAACAMDHANDLRECDFFLVTRVSKSGAEYEVDFAVGMHAKEMALSMSARLLHVCGELGANVNTVESTAKKLKADSGSWRRNLRALGAEKLAGIVPQKVGRFSLLRSTFSNLDDDQLVEFAGSNISSDGTIVLIANRGPESSRIVFARNEGMAAVDCNAIFKKAAGSDGRGGGKPNFVTGSARSDAVDRIVDDISRAISELS